MTTKFDAVTAAALAPIDQTKLEWATKLQAALGSTMRLRMFWDASASAQDPFLTGTEFLNVGIVGPFTVTAGNITNFGVLTGVTTNLAADLSTGSACLRVEGNGRFMQCSLGRVGSGKDYQLSANPQGGNTGFAFVSGSGVKAPALLNSGTGYLAPPDPVYSLELEDWSTGSAGTLQTVAISKRLVNYVYDDAEMQASQGDIRTMITPTSMVIGEIEYGAMLWASNPAVNAEGSDPLIEVLPISKPVSANWPGYPRKSGYITDTSNTFAPPHKLHLKKNGVRIYTFEMRDGLPMNHPTLNQNQSYSKTLLETNPIRPFLNCAQVMPYRSARQKMHTYAQKYYPGQEAYVLRPTSGRRRTSTNPAIPFVDGRNQSNGLNNWFAAPKWPGLATPAGYAADINLDPYLYDYKSGEVSYGNMPGGAPFWTGWGWEPGAIGLHDQFAGPGGARFDRAPVPGPIAIYMTNPSYTRPKNNEPIQEMVEAWIRNYGNISWHLFTDVTTGSTIPVDEVFKGMWAQGGHAYYGSNDSYVPGGTAYTVDMFSIANGATNDHSKPYAGAFVDKNNRMPFNGVETDDNHAYKSAFFACLLFNSPMMAHMTKHAVIMNILARLGSVAPESNPKSYFLTRVHAWRMKNYMEAWKLSSDHPWGISRKIIEDTWVKELEAQYDAIVAPQLAGATDVYNQGLRKLGVPFQHNPGYWEMMTQSLMFYMAGVLQLMKSTGSWDMIRAKSTKCRDVINFIMRCMDIYSIDWIIGTRGVVDWYESGMFTGDFSPIDNVNMAANWAEVGVNRNAPATADWVTNENGSFKEERDGSQHLRYQYLCVRRDWITTAEVPLGSVNSLAAGIAAYKGYYDKVNANVNSLIASNAAKDVIRNNDFGVQQASYGVIKPPVTV